MCVIGCLESVGEQISRRGLFGGAALAAAAAVDPGASRAAPSVAVSKVVDLTHSYSNKFPHYRGGMSQVDLEPLASNANGDDWNVFRWVMDEHAGTHIDAPFHRNPQGIKVDQISPQDLVLSLAVIDIKARAATDPDAMVTVDDIRKWEKKHGRLPERCCAAMNSGWDKKVNRAEFIGFDGDNVRHFPGFSRPAAEFLLQERSVVAIASDTPSLDHGKTEQYPVHVLWLGSNRYGLENVANLDKCPPRGATLVAGAPKIAGASGGHTRILALV